VCVCVCVFLLTTMNDTRRPHELWCNYKTAYILQKYYRHLGVITFATAADKTIRMSESIFSVKCLLGSKNLWNTVQSQFSESQLLEVLFHLSQCSIVKFVSMLGTIFS